MTSSKSKTTAYVIIPQNLPLHCGKFESTITYLFSILTDWSNNDPPSAIGIRHRVLALAHDGMQQSAIVCRVGRTRTTINCILWRHAATPTLVPGRFPGAPWNTTSRQDCALLRMVWQDRFISARALMAWINNWLLSRSHHAYRLTRKPLLTANHHRFCLEWAQS